MQVIVVEKLEEKDEARGRERKQMTSIPVRDDETVQ